MTRRRLGTIIGVSTAVWNGLLLQVQDLARARWEEHLRQSGRLVDWWLLLGLLFIGGYSVIMALLILLVRRYLGVRVVPIAASVLIDFAMMTVFWGLDAIFRDPLLSGFLAGVGLRYLHTVCFWTGIFWFLIAFVRLKILFPGDFGRYASAEGSVTRNPLNPATQSQH